MVELDWNSPELIQKTDFIFSQLVVFMLGLYGWQVFLTLRHVEWPLATRRLRFRWPFVPYLIARHILLAFLISLVMLNKPTKPCHESLERLSLLGNISVAAASTNLFVRTLTLWYRKRWVQAFLTLCTVGHWAAAFASALIDVDVENVAALIDVDTDTPTCGGMDSHDVRAVFTFYFSTTVYGAVILVFTVVSLYSRCLAHASPVWDMLYRQGIWYFIAMLLVNLIVLVFAGLRLNPVMNIFFTVPAIVVSVIVSSQAVVSLVKLKEDITGSASTSHEHNATGSADTGKGEQFTSNIHLTASIDENFVDMDMRVAGPHTGTAVLFHAGSLPMNHMEVSRPPSMNTSVEPSID